MLDFALESSLVVIAALLYRRSLSAGARRSATFVMLFSSLVLFQGAIDVYLTSLLRGGQFAENINSGKWFH
jgi:hypothetical protein